MQKILIKKAAAEFIGTLALVFFGCGSIALGHTSGHNPLLAQVPWIFGLTVTVMIYALGHISGAHFNPAVTLAFAAARRFPFRELPTYWAAQFLGAIMGITLVAWLIPNATNLGTTTTSLISVKALVLEAILSFFLMFVIISVATDSRAVGIMAGAAIGLTVALGAFLGGPLTGASMNPARSLAPALLTGQFHGVWIYFLGPVIGACMAAYLYEWIRCDGENLKHDPDKHAKGCC